MAILVLTKQPARVRRIALEIQEEVALEADASNIAACISKPWQLVLVDYDVATDSIALVRAAAAANNRVILFMREPSLMKIVEATKAGAYDVVNLPIDVERMRDALATTPSLLPSWEAAVSRTSSHEWIGSSPAMLDAFRLAARAALGSTNVLIVGETGVGKGLLARVIHEQSERRDHPFLDMNCAAMDDTLFAAELFGSAGAPAGRATVVLGQLTRAAAGTVFLNEISQLSGALQTRVASAMKDKSFVPIASFERQTLSARVIAASNRNLRMAAARNEFAPELLYEFGVEIAVPPLRHRTEDIPVLASYFLEHYASAHNKDIQGFDAAALDILEKYDWPGNVRQLRNVVERAVVAAFPGVIRTKDLPADVTGARDLLQDTDGGSVALEGVERRHIRQIWRLTGGHLGETADLLGIHRNTLRRKLEQYGITEEDARV